MPVARVAPPGVSARRETSLLSRLDVASVCSLAEPYLRGFQPVRENRGGLYGYWFLRRGERPATASLGGKMLTAARQRRATEMGFFLGYLLRPGAIAGLDPQPPECLVGACVLPVAGARHRALVSGEGSLARKTFVYIGWLTHRPPRFAFSEDGLFALVRHTSMRVWPRGKYRHLSRNFFIETLAWLVRSGLVAKLLAERVPGAARTDPSGTKSNLLC